MAQKISKLIFTSMGKRFELCRGEVYKNSRNNDYRDAPENVVNKIIKDINEGRRWRDLIKEAFENKNPWLYKIITAKSRTLFLDQYPIKKNSFILDIGSGWGQFTLPLAKENIVCALEPTPERLGFISAVSHQERKNNNIFFISDDYLNVKFETKFDYALCIGVLEWIGSYSDEDPQNLQKKFIKKIKQELSPKGKLIIGIENRIGLKYLLGTNDDHTGLPNISSYEAPIAKNKYKNHTGKELKIFTYSKNELKLLLTSVGFTNIEFFAALPDYKIPEVILPLNKKLESYFKSYSIIELDGSNGEKLSNQEELISTYKLLAELKISSNFIPSFYVVAS